MRVYGILGESEEDRADRRLVEWLKSARWFGDAAGRATAVQLAQRAGSGRGGA